MKGQLIIAVDFDGTLVEHEFPRIGPEITGAVGVLKALQKIGAKLILYTMRSGLSLDQALRWCADRQLHFWAVNENPGQKHWTESNKVYATHYIDDAAVGCPLIHPAEGRRPYVDWARILEHFTKQFAEELGI